MSAADWIVAILGVAAFVFIGALVILNAALDSDGRRFR